MLSTFSCSGKTHSFHDVREAVGHEAFDELPFAARVLAENILRHLGQPGSTHDVLERFVQRNRVSDSALALRIPRIILPDSSGIPVLMDLAALRSAAVKQGARADMVDTSVPVDLIVDHSLQVDAHASPDAEAINTRREFERNAERYRFLKWSENAFSSLRIFPPGSGIIHQVHLEQIAQVALVDRTPQIPIVFPDMALGGDSHTPMINALGVLGWGVGGIEAEMVVLGQPYVLPVPEFVGVRLQASLRPGVTVTDLALTVTSRLRREGVLGAFIEFFGPAALQLSVPDRATLANMAPEYGATTGFWPIDQQTLSYLRITGRSAHHAALVEAHARAAGLFREESDREPQYDRVVEIDLAEVGRSVAGPSKPHNLRSASSLGESHRERMTSIQGAQPADKGDLDDGAIVIAAITSCTNTANPHAMVRAGLVAKAAVDRGLKPPPWVKTSLAPGSRAVTGYLEKADLLASLEGLGFHVIGYGCTTCGGKSGPLTAEAMQLADQGRQLIAVLSGNRNFDGRIHRLVGASYLCSPALVVAYALAGKIGIDIERDPLAHDQYGAPIYLRDLWPADDVVDTIVRNVVTADVFQPAGSRGLGMAGWDVVESPDGMLYPWDPSSTYILEPPFFAHSGPAFAVQPVIRGARVLGIFADGLTTDHISPGGEIPPDSPAGHHLKSLGIAPAQFNTYVGRRGNHDVMARATYSNLRTQNRMVPERAGWWTRTWPDGELASYYEASVLYRERRVPLIVLAGFDFGSGSSRDWAAKGPALLGIGAVIARSFERIHRSNLIGLGIVPLVFEEGQSVDSLGLTGDETLTLEGLPSAIANGTRAAVLVQRPDGSSVTFSVKADLRSEAEAEILVSGGMFHAALKRVSARDLVT